MTVLTPTIVAQTLGNGSSQLHVVEFDPAGGAVPLAFIGAAPSTVITETTIGSTNDNTSFQYDTNFFLANFEFMVTGTEAAPAGVASGTFLVDTLEENSLQVVVFTDLTCFPPAVLDWLTNGGDIPSGVGCVLQLQQGNRSLYDSAGTPSEIGEGALLVEVASDAITVLDQTVTMNLATYPYMFYIVTQDIITESAPADVPTFTFASTLAAEGGVATIPEDAPDGTILEVVNTDGTVAGKSVLINDWLLVYSGGTKVRILPREPTPMPTG